MTRDEIMAEISYDPETGVFTRLRPVQGGRVGPMVLKPHKWTGYTEIQVRRQKFRAHRVAWLLAYGEWPPGDIDHIDRNRANNKISNMRIATDSQNRANSKINKNNTTGIRGVNWNARDKKYQAIITKDGVRRSLGYFDSIQDAAAAYTKAAVELFGEFAAPIVTP
ncbi:MAG: HNH endonuclease signature motif containing protein [Armatimonadia bacterium]